MAAKRPRLDFCIDGSVVSDIYIDYLKMTKQEIRIINSLWFSTSGIPLNQIGMCWRIRIFPIAHLLSTRAPSFWKGQYEH